MKKTSLFVEHILTALISSLPYSLNTVEVFFDDLKLDYAPKFVRWKLERFWVCKDVEVIRKDARAVVEIQCFLVAK